MDKEIRTFSRQSAAENAIPFGIAPLANAPLYVWSTLLRRHTFFLLVWIETGEGWHYVDFERAAVQPCTLFLIAPNQIQYWDVKMPPPTGWHLHFDREFFLLNGLEQFFSKLTLFNSLNPIFAIRFEEKQAATITEQFEQIAQEFRTQSDGWVESISAHLQLLLIQAQRQKATLQPPDPQTSATILARQFSLLVKQDISANCTVNSYAEQLGVTAGHLTETVKKVTGLSAGTVIRRQLALEAKRWLAHTDWSAAQIADQLGFKDASYFGRFVKREIGQSPGSFRKHFNQFLHLKGSNHSSESLVLP